MAVKNPERCPEATHWKDPMLERYCSAEFMRSDKAHGDYQLAYSVPCIKKGNKYVEIPMPHNNNSTER